MAELLFKIIVILQTYPKAHSAAVTGQSFKRPKKIDEILLSAVRIFYKFVNKIQLFGGNQTVLLKGLTQIIIQNRTSLDIFPYSHPMLGTREFQGNFLKPHLILLVSFFTCRPQFLETFVKFSFIVSDYRHFVYPPRMVLLLFLLWETK